MGERWGRVRGPVRTGAVGEPDRHPAVGLRSWVLAVGVALAVQTPWTTGLGARAPAPPEGAAGLDADALDALIVPRGPARVYARPFRIARGDHTERLGLDGQLRALGYRRVASAASVEPGTYARSQSAYRIGRRAFRYAGASDDGGTVALDLDPDGGIERLRDASDAELAETWLEPELIGYLHDGSGRDQAPVRIEDLPPQLLTAVLQVEDQRFFEHTGLDTRRIAGALLANLRARRIEQGGSTITQQLARSVFLSNERSFARKLREAWLALQIESKLTKGEILESYLNEVYLGQRGGIAIHGVGAAARHYFGKPLREVDLAEAALLAGVIRGPSLYDPFRSPERARKRRDAVLRMLLARGEIDQAAFERALAHALPEHPVESPPDAFGYVLDAVRGELARWPGADSLPGLTVFTSVDSRMQRVAHRSVMAGLEELEAAHPELRNGEPLQAALVALDVRTGEVLSVVGGRNHRRYPFNRALRAHRQPGSLFKPVVALAAIVREGAAPSYTLASRLEDAPLSLYAGGELWEPVNYDQTFRGVVSLRTALEKSLNLPFVHLGRELGGRRIVRAARRLGIESPLPAVASLPLGSAEVTLWEMTRAYGVIAACGMRRSSRLVIALRRRGELADPEPAEASKVLSSDEAFLLTSALRGVVTRGTGTRLFAYGLEAPVAGKTGSTDDNRDGWFVGYTPQLVAGVWVGYDDHRRSIGVTGSHSALPIFARFANQTMSKEQRSFEIPQGVDAVEIDPASGRLATALCPGRTEYFLAGTAPTRPCEPALVDDFLGWSKPPE